VHLFYHQGRLVARRIAGRKKVQTLGFGFFDLASPKTLANVIDMANWE
jgi:hypothetical protein